MGTAPDTQNSSDRLLIVDEDSMSCELMQFKLQSEGFAVTVTRNGADALQAISSSDTPFSLILVDLMDNPVMSGLQFARNLRRNIDTMNIPFIIISRRAGEDDIVSGLDAGADDYIPKPFSSRELVARVRSVLRRRKILSRRRMSNIMSFGGLTLDLGTSVVTIDGANVNFSRTEFLILAMLLRNRNQFFDRAEIIHEAWDNEREGGVSERAVDTTVSRLRKKLGDYGRNIVNRQGLGYGFIE